MEIITKVNADLMQPGYFAQTIVAAKQNEKLTRKVQMSLYAGGLAWNIPSGAAAVIRYKKKDGTAGLYDTLPDDTPAVDMTEGTNTVTVTLAPQVLTAAGDVKMDVLFTDGNAALATFDVLIRVHPSPVSNSDLESQSYYKYGSLAQLNAAILALENIPGLGYATCETAGTEQVKTTGAIRNFSFVTGAVLSVKFLYANSAENPKLSAGGIKGWILNKVSGAPISAKHIGIGVHRFLLQNVDSTYSWLLLDPAGEGAASSSSGLGGYYTPTVSQPESGSMQIGFTPSDAAMTPVAPVTVALPQGPKGDPGEQGPKGDTGKSAYVYAQEAGYTGSEAVFGQTMAAAAQLEAAAAQAAEEAAAYAVKAQNSEQYAADSALEAQDAATQAQAAQAQTKAYSEDAEGCADRAETAALDAEAAAERAEAAAGGTGSAGTVLNAVVYVEKTVTVEADSAEVLVDIGDPTRFDVIFYQVKRATTTASIQAAFLCVGRGRSSAIVISDHYTDGGMLLVKPITRQPYCLRTRGSNPSALMTTGTGDTWYEPTLTKETGIKLSMADGSDILAGTQFAFRGYAFTGS